MSLTAPPEKPLLCLLEYTPLQLSPTSHLIPWKNEFCTQCLRAEPTHVLSTAQLTNPYHLLTTLPFFHPQPSTTSLLPFLKSHVTKLAHNATNLFISIKVELLSCDLVDHNYHWQTFLPSLVMLHLSSFGQFNINQSFTQEAAFKTILFHLLESGFPSHQSAISLMIAYPLLHQLDTTMRDLATYTLCWIGCINPN